MSKRTIYLVEDDLSFGAVLKSYLELHDFEVTWTKDGKDAIQGFQKASYDICILDVMLPNIDGFSIGKTIKKTSKNTPIIFLTAKSLKEDILEGYALGADDYITKPFDSDVLLAKINAVLSRAGNAQPSSPQQTLTLGNYEFDLHLRKLTYEDIVINLSPKESSLLALLIQHKNKLLPRSLALNTIWNDDSYFTTRSMDVYITKIRKYLKKDQRISIENIHGSGYMLLEAKA